MLEGYQIAPWLPSQSLYCWRSFQQGYSPLEALLREREHLMILGWTKSLLSLPAFWNIQRQYLVQDDKGICICRESRVLKEY